MIPCMREACPFYKPWFCVYLQKVMWPWIRICPVEFDFEEDEEDDR